MGVFVESLKSWLSAGVGFIYPEVCQLCSEARATASDGFVCGACRKRVRFVNPPFCERCGRPYDGAISTRFECARCLEIEPHFDTARAAVLARDPVLDVIHRYKYQRAMWFEPFLAGLLVARAEPELRQETWHWIVPVPLHPAKERQREFNQAGRLAARLSAATKIPVHDRLLRRVVPTRSQTQLSREERLANMHQAFAMWPGQKLNGERIVLVDDVLTTGATTSACAKVLRKAGAGDVCVWTVARGT